MLKHRVLTALALLVLVVGLLWGLPSTAAPYWLAVLLALMAWEWAGLTALSGRISMIYALGSVGVFAGVWWFWSVITQDDIWVMLTALNTLVAVIAVKHFARSGRWQPFWQSLLRFFGFPWLVNFVLVFAVVLQTLGIGWLLYALAIVWVMDTGAYFAGKCWGRHKLAPLVSPGKTWEGVLGGLLAVSAFTVSVALLVSVSVADLLVIALPVAALSVYGDLFESAMKRQAGVKDSSQMLPGHGGWLDRMDAQILALPLFWLLWQGVKGS
jgi:phosphatidate cytidylyltransferase